MTDDTRRFNSRQRVALYLAADGRCTRCGVELGPSWHADHMIPYSAGGSTDVINGQALCPRCNLRKGSSTAMPELRSWQSDALAKFIKTTDDFLTVATPGAGKTTFALIAAQRLIDRDEIQRVLVVVPTEHLRIQWATAAAQLGIQLDHRFANGAGALAKDFDGAVITYSAVANQPQLWRKLATAVPSLVILDEVHHASQDSRLTWGSALQQAFDPPVRRRLLLSGTPFRSDNTPIPFVRYDSSGKCCPSYNYDYGQALQDRTVVRPIEFSALDGDVRWRDAGAIISTALADADDDTLTNALASALDPDGDWIESVLRRANDELSRQRMETFDAGGLVVAADQGKARRYAGMLARISGEEPTLAISDELESSTRISDFARGSSRWIVAVQMVSEGVDIPRLSVGVYASRIRTEMFFRQVVGRFVRMRGAEDATCATLLIPSIQPLLSYAHAIESIQDRALSEEQERLQREVKERQGSLFLNLVQPLDSSEAIHHSTILSGDSYTEEELQRAGNILQLSAMPSNVSHSQMASALRMAGAGRVVGSAVVDPPPVRPLAEEKASFRRLLNRRVAYYRNLTSYDYPDIHAKLNRLHNDTVKTATLDTLQQRLATLDHWIEAVQ